MAENIWLAASDGLLDAVKGFVASGVSVNAQDENGYCPLTAAVSYSHAELTKWLLANGADPGLRDHDGDTPLHQCETEECGALLVAAGADPYAENAEGKSPFVVAAEEGRKEMSRWLASLYEAAGKPLPAVEEAEDDEDDEDDDDDEDGDEDEEGADEGGK